MCSSYTNAITSRTVPSFDFLIHGRPVSVQSSRRGVYQEWKRLVRAEAEKRWAGRPVVEAAVRLTIVFLCYEVAIDVDNVVKPIQDALTGVVYADDEWVTDVDSHRRFFTDAIDLDRLPPLLVGAVVEASECVYVRVEPALPLEEYL